MKREWHVYAVHRMPTFTQVTIRRPLSDGSFERIRLKLTKREAADLRVELEEPRKRGVVV